MFAARLKHTKVGQESKLKFAFNSLHTLHCYFHSDTVKIYEILTNLDRSPLLTPPICPHQLYTALMLNQLQGFYLLNNYCIYFNDFCYLFVLFLDAALDAGLGAAPNNSVVSPRFWWREGEDDEGWLEPARVQEDTCHRKVKVGERWRWRRVGGGGGWGEREGLGTNIFLILVQDPCLANLSCVKLWI